jgi:hypothetical protein
VNPETVTSQSQTPEQFLDEIASLPEVEFPELTLNDRCDADSAEAAVAQVRLPSGRTLLFCSHHWRENSEKLSAFPHSVPEEESQPFTWRRAAELGAPSQRDAGSSI